MNWTIDVPMLQIQLLAIIGVAGATFLRSAAKFVVCGLAMIYFSYVAQFFEGGFILYSVKTDVFNNVSHMTLRAQKIMRGIWWLFLGSWTGSAVAIAMPAIAFNAGGSGTLASVDHAASVRVARTMISGRG